LGKADATGSHYADQQQNIGSPRDHANRFRIKPSSSSTSVLAASAFITTTVRNPSAIARGAWVIAKMPANLRKAPA
jgi:hypothetical protein